MKYRLKDRALQKRLDAISGGDFSQRLQDPAKSEKGFAFFQNFLKDTGILKELEEKGIQDGDTVKMYGLQFDYYK